MTTINAVGNGLTSATGTGNFVGSTAPTISNPIINAIYDTNDNVILGLNAVSSAVNYINVFNNATGDDPAIVTTGTDTDIGLTISAKGAGTILLESGATVNQLIIGTGPSLVHTTNFSFPSNAANQTVTWPDATGTVSLYTTGTFLPTLVSSGGGTCTYSTQSASYTQMGNMIFATISLVLSTSSLSAGTLSIQTLPVSSPVNTACSVYVSGLAATAITQIEAISSGTQINLGRYAAGVKTDMTDTDVAPGSSFYIAIAYQT
jgi:hypothetical protein